MSVSQHSSQSSFFLSAFLPKDIRDSRRRTAAANKPAPAALGGAAAGGNTFTAAMLMTTEECYGKVTPTLLRCFA